MIIRWRFALIAALLLPLANDVHAGAYIFVGNGTEDRVTHPRNYSGFGGEADDLTVCIDSSVDPDGVAAQAEASLRKVVETYNRLRSLPDNNLAADGSTEVPNGMIDFESVALHELGHCQGLGHINHGSESGLPDPASNGTRSSPGTNGSLNQAAGPDGLHGSADDVRGDDVNRLWYIRGQNNPGLQPTVVDSSTMARALTALPVGHLFAVNADKSVMAALGFPNTESVMQQNNVGQQVQRHLAHDDVVTLRLARAGLDRVAGNKDDYTYKLRYIGMLNAPNNGVCNVRVRLDRSTSLGICVAGAGALDADDMQVTTGNIAFNSQANWYFSPGENTRTTITSPPPPAGAPGTPYTVSVTVRESAGISIPGNPRGVVEVSDDTAAPGTPPCTITLAGTTNETGSCELMLPASGTPELRAQYLGFGGWDASMGTSSDAMFADGFE